MFKRVRKLPSISRLREALSYDPETGIFRWKIRGRGYRFGQIAGHLNEESGYWFIRLDGALFRAHRAAWALMKGRWPSFEIDHKDRDRGNCRWRNLRRATRLQNAANQSLSPRNTTGFAGVSLATSKKRFRAEIRVARQRIHLGYFESAAAAGAARAEASAKYRGEFSPC